MTIEMATYEFVDLCFGGSVEVLEFVHSLELDDVQAIGKNTIRFPLEEMLGLVSGNVRNGGEDIGAVGSRAFDAVSVVYATLACLVIDIKVLEVIVKVDAASAEVAAEESGVRGEDGGDIDVTLATEGDSETSLPFVKMGDDGGIELACGVLRGCIDIYTDRVMSME